MNSDKSANMKLDIYVRGRNMKKLRDYIISILNGSVMVTDGMRCGMVTFVVIAVSFSILVLFSIVQCNIAALYYLIIIPIIYIVTVLLCKQKLFIICHCFLYFTVMLSCMATCFLVGWTSGFSLYNMAIVPVSFYMVFMTSNYAHKIKIAFVWTLINLGVTLASRVYVYSFGYYYHYNYKVALFISIFNMLIAFLILGFFSVLYIVEIRYSKKQLERKNAELNLFASYDSLTQLLNRYSMKKIMNHTWMEANKSEKTFTIVLGDIDDFKLVNDTYGHVCGDAVLTEIAALLKESVSGNDAVCRWGGEEFLIILKRPMEQAIVQIEALRKKIEERIIYFANTKISITMTFGLIESSHATEIDEMINLADDMMYQGKNSGKNQLVYNTITKNGEKNES